MEKLLSVMECYPFHRLGSVFTHTHTHRGGGLRQTALECGVEPAFVGQVQGLGGACCGSCVELWLHACFRRDMTCSGAAWKRC